LDCPGTECWQALFSGTFPPDQVELYERHLDSCPACQARLDQAEEYRDELRRLGRQVGDPTVVPADPTLAQVLRKLHEARLADGPGVEEPMDLSFLAPSDRPGVLGTLGKYEVEEVIGRGGMGIVLRASDPELQRPVAIKVLAPVLAASPTARRRFVREGQAAAAVCR